LGDAFLGGEALSRGENGSGARTGGQSSLKDRLCKIKRSRRQIQIGWDFQRNFGALGRYQARQAGLA
jgi:hypothetical protein